jgi:hypothetical protein
VYISEQARRVKTVNVHSCDSQVLYGLDRRFGPGMLTTCTVNQIARDWVTRRSAHICYKTLVFYKVAWSAQCTVRPTQAKSESGVPTRQLCKRR